LPELRQSGARTRRHGGRGEGDGGQMCTHLHLSFFSLLLFSVTATGSEREDIMSAQTAAV
jgi:hypothetical protein